MKFKQIAPGVPFCVPGDPAIMVRCSSLGNEQSSFVLVLGSGDIVHVSRHGGTECLERDDYYLAKVTYEHGHSE